MSDLETVVFNKSSIYKINDMFFFIDEENNKHFMTEKEFNDSICENADKDLPPVYEIAPVVSVNYIKMLKNKQSKDIAALQSALIDSRNRISELISKITKMEDLLGKSGYSRYTDIALAFLCGMAIASILILMVV